MENPFESLPPDFEEDVLTRCKEYKIVKIEKEIKDPLRYRLIRPGESAPDPEDVEIPHFYVHIQIDENTKIYDDEDGFIDENAFFEYMDTAMTGSPHWQPWKQNWYVIGWPNSSTE